MEEEIKKEKKIHFAGVNPDLLRATIPSAAPPEPRARETAPIPPSPTLAPPQPEMVETGFSKSDRMTGERHDAYGIQQGKEACLRSVLQRLRSGRMNSVEEAKAMVFLLQNGVVASQAELAEAMGKPKSKVSEKLSILKLPRSVLLLIERHPEVITEGHAVELMRLKEPALILNVAERILENKLTRDRLRVEIGFLLKKHGEAPTATASVTKPKREGKSRLRYFPRVDGGFDVVYRFRPDGNDADLALLVGDLENKLAYLKKFQDEKKKQADLTAVIAEDIRAEMVRQREARQEKPAARRETPEAGMPVATEPVKESTKRLTV